MTHTEGVGPAEASTRRPAPPRSRSGAWRAALGPTLISAASVAIVFGALGWWITSSPQWGRVQAQFFSLENMQAAFPRVLQGFWVSMRVWLTALACIASGRWCLR
jgi:polar amino acid transport system permease protein